ncbi:hypothetical protein BGX23_005828 [Mortierella sp. AD031]|nr:hypothetical protein BGX23_005828 [Mortierella sp. AD031]KAG0208192.1 hypothetical protein BGX33_006394 [Mortierella sp. NVP41]
MEEPDLMTLVPVLKHHEEQHGQQHPLSSLHITGCVERPCKMLMDALAQFPVEFESLALGLTWDCRMDERNGSRLVPEDSSTFDFIAALTLSKDSLVNLDVSCVDFSDKDSALQFFTRL